MIGEFFLLLFTVSMAWFSADCLHRYLEKRRLFDLFAAIFCAAVMLRAAL